MKDITKRNLLDLELKVLDSLVKMGDMTESAYEVAKENAKEISNHTEAYYEYLYAQHIENLDLTEDEFNLR